MFADAIADPQKEGTGQKETNAAQERLDFIRLEPVGLTWPPLPCPVLLPLPHGSCPLPHISSIHHHSSIYSYSYNSSMSSSLAVRLATCSSPCGDFTIEAPTRARERDATGGLMPALVRIFCGVELPGALAGSWSLLQPHQPPAASTSFGSLI